MTDRLERLDYYTLLGVDADASRDDIKAAFRQFARRYHPDRFTGDDGARRARATQIYRRGSEAFQVLSRPTSRRAYDRVLSRGKTRLSGDDADREAIAEQRAKQPKRRPPAIRSTSARAYYERSAEEARAGRWREAWKLMKRAQEVEPDSQLIGTRLAQIEARLRTSRR